MEKFPIKPDDCLILKAIKNSNSLREAASLLSCDPAGLARRVRQISSDHGFLQKVNNRWIVIEQGLYLIEWAESSIQSQKKILSAKNSLRIGATMWFSEEVLIPNISKLKGALGSQTNITISVPQNSFELSLIDGSVDFIVVCHPPENPEIAHKQVMEEYWVLIAPKAWQKELKSKVGERLLDELVTKPFIRHTDMNLDLFLPTETDLTESGISIDNLIGIRKAVSEGLGWSLVPKILVRQELDSRPIITLPIEIPVKDRKVCLWWLRHRTEVKRQSSRISAWIKDGCS